MYFVTRASRETLGGVGGGNLATCPLSDFAPRARDVSGSSSSRSDFTLACFLLPLRSLPPCPSPSLKRIALPARVKCLHSKSFSSSIFLITCCLATRKPWEREVPCVLCSQSRFPDLRCLQARSAGLRCELGGRREPGFPSRGPGFCLSRLHLRAVLSPNHSSAGRFWPLVSYLWDFKMIPPLAIYRLQRDK